MIRRFGEAPKADRTYRPRPGAYAVIRQGYRVLLTHQAEPEPEFQLPGGGIDPGENPIPALCREVIEETGYSIRVERKLGVFRRFTYMPEYNLWAEKVCHIYLARPGLCLGPPTEIGHSAHWTPVEQALPLVYNDGDRHFMAMAFSGVCTP